MNEEIVVRIDLDALKGRAPMLIRLAGPDASFTAEFGPDPDVQLHWTSNGWSVHSGSDSRVSHLRPDRWSRVGGCELRLSDAEGGSFDALRTHTVWATPELIVTDENGHMLPGSPYALPTNDGARFVIGRADEADLRLTPRSVSRRHCVISVRNGQHWIEDTGSAWGTLIGGSRLRKPKRLMHGVIVEVGTLRVRFHHPSAEPAAKGLALQEALEALCPKQQRQRARADRRRMRHERWVAWRGKLWRPEWLVAVAFATVVLTALWFLHSQLEVPTP